MRKTKKIALFDMDGSLFDYDGAMRKSLALLKYPGEPEYEGNFYVQEKHPHIKARMNLIKAVPGWWRNLPRMEDGFRMYNLAKELGFQCHILTKGPRAHPNAWTEKLECCQYHLGDDIRVHITQNKEMVRGDVLYDDFIPYMKDWLDADISGLRLGIMPQNESNKNWFNKNVIKWAGEESVFEFIKSELQNILAR